tara:strand:- start:686 stop:2524 length:1839 start_codon:yes stop_codon:yes gene_type:complete
MTKTVSESPKTYVLDTSIVIEHKASDLIQKNKLTGTILICQAVISELENQANRGLEIGFLGLEEVQTLQSLAKEDKITLKIIGERPSINEIKFAKQAGAIDALICDLAAKHRAILITADKVQSESAKAQGLEVMFIEASKRTKKLSFLSYFDKSTMSVHIKENQFVYAKRGTPGDWSLKKVTKQKLDTVAVRTLARELVDRTRSEVGSFVEIERRGSTILQYQKYRVIMVKPPVSDGFEITIVAPIKKLSLNQYKLPPKILKRLQTTARGILIAGETGSGKSTFVQAVAEQYIKHDRIVKTVESPRDLLIEGNITQYSKSYTTNEAIHDILLLSRPDYIIFDEIRNAPDFALYTDLKLAGSNCLGVIHASAPIDAIQRFVGKLDIGMISSVIDTIIFIHNGSVSETYILEQKVKVPSGMTEDDLARPVIEVINAITKETKFELYTYGDQTVVMPIKNEIEKSVISIFAEESIEKRVKEVVKIPVTVKLTGKKSADVFIEKDAMSSLIGKKGEVIEGLEQELGLKLQAKEAGQEVKEVSLKSVSYTIHERGNKVSLDVGNKYKGQNAQIWINDEFFMDVIIGKKGEIKMNSSNQQVKKLLKAFTVKDSVEVRV